MHNIRRIAPIVVITLVILAALWALSRQGNQAQGGDLTASGIIEATQVTLSPEIGGRVQSVSAGEGDPVQAGDVLVQLDASLLAAQRGQAQAGLALARASAEAAEGALQAARAAEAAAQAGLDAASANRDLVAAGALEEQRQALQAQLSQAEASLRALRATLSAATAEARPEEIAAARQRLEQARQAYAGLNVALSDDQLEDVRLALSRADGNLARAEARQRSLRAEPDLPASALEAARRTVEECQGASDLARQALEAAQDPDRPYAEQIEAARLTLDAARRNLAQAQARQDYLQTLDDLAQIALDAAQDAVDDAQDLVDAAQDTYDALAEDDQAQRLEGVWDEVQDALGDLNGLARFAVGSASPTLETLLNQIDAAQAQRDAAAANLALLERGAPPEQLAAAEAGVRAAQAQRDATAAQARAAEAQRAMAQAQVESAQSALEGVEVQISRLALAAPVDGVVLVRSIEPGEIASPGAALLVLGQLEELTITVYLPEDRYGELLLGQTAQVTVDSYPGEVFQGVVVRIADEAEFTPRNVQTAEGRRTTVFAVRLSIPNAAGKLKPGMPADVVFKP